MVTTGVAGLDEQAHLVVLLHGHALLARGTNAASRAFLNFFFLACAKKLRCLGIAAGQPPSM